MFFAVSTTPILSRTEPPPPSCGGSPLLVGSLRILRDPRTERPAVRLGSQETVRATSPTQRHIPKKNNNNKPHTHIPTSKYVRNHQLPKPPLGSIRSDEKWSRRVRTPLYETGPTPQRPTLRRRGLSEIGGGSGLRFSAVFRRTIEWRVTREDIRRGEAREWCFRG